MSVLSGLEAKTSFSASKVRCRSTSPDGARALAVTVAGGHVQPQRLVEAPRRLARDLLLVVGVVRHAAVLRLTRRQLDHLSIKTRVSAARLSYIFKRTAAN